MEDLFQQAADLPEADRAAFLDERCRSRDDVRRKVDLLLRHDQAVTRSFLVQPAVAVDSVEPGRSIGPYQVLERIGEGAFGDVYLAEQTAPFRRRVALKVIKPGMDTRQVIARFRAERQAMAMLDHPNIASVFDAGTTESGRPYFVMEYVPGEPLTRFCKRMDLDTDARLRLFLRVCNAIQHAHQKGIIHRDVKPSNVLVEVVGEEPVPKVIDFGIAKAIGFSLTERTVHTERGQLIGTPEYMSPEQAEMTGFGIDTRTDIYSLGVVLYELLVGVLPFDPATMRSGTIADIQKRIREEMPPTPSTRLSQLGDEVRTVNAPALRRRLRGDLDWITMKAMEKDRSRRYSSVSELAADLERHLNDEPVLAGPPGTIYRFGKFIRRNRAVAAGVTIAFVALVVGTAVATWQAVRARAEAERAIRVTEFLGNTIGATDFIEAGQRLQVADVLDEAAERLAETFQDEPEIQAQIMHLLGLSYFSMSEFEESLEHLRGALDLRRETLGTDHPDTLETAHRLGDILAWIWQNREAQEILRGVVERRTRTLGANHPDTLWSMARLASTLKSVYKLDEAEVMARTAAEGLAGTVGADHERTLSANETLSGVLARAGRDREAEELLQATLDEARRSLGNEKRTTLRLQRLWAARLSSRGEWSKVEPLYRSAFETHRQLFGDDYRTFYNMWTLGSALCYRGQAKEGRQLLDDGIDGLHRLFGERHPHTAYAIGALADVQLAAEDYDGAEESSRKCLSILREWLGDAHPNVLVARADLARVLCLNGKCDEAKEHFRDAMQLYRTTDGSDPLQTARMFRTYAEVLDAQDRRPEAEPLWREGLEVLKVALGEENPRTLRAGVLYGRCLLELDRFDDCESVLLPAYRGGNQTALGLLIELYDASGKPEKAAEYRELLREAGGTEASE